MSNYYGYTYCIKPRYTVLRLEAVRLSLLVHDGIDTNPLISIT